MPIWGHLKDVALMSAIFGPVNPACCGRVKSLRVVEPQLDLTQHKKNNVEGKRLHPSNKDVIFKETQMHSGFLITSIDKHVPEFKLQMTAV